MVLFLTGHIQEIQHSYQRFYISVSLSASGLVNEIQHSQNNYWPFFPQAMNFSNIAKRMSIFFDTLVLTHFHVSLKAAVHKLSLSQYLYHRAKKCPKNPALNLHTSFLFTQTIQFT